MSTATLLNKNNIAIAQREAADLLTGLNFNCWAGTLFALDKIDSLYWMSQGEIIDFIEKQTVRLDEAEPLREGDILVLYNNYEGLIHTAVYTEAGEFWHKVGGCRAEYAGLNRILSIYNDYTRIEYRRLV